VFSDEETWGIRWVNGRKDEEVREGFQLEAQNLSRPTEGAFPLALRKRLEDLRRKLADVACAEGKDEVACVCLDGDGGDRSGKIGSELDVGRSDFFRKALGRHAGNGLLAGSVNGQYNYRVRIDKCAGELIHQIQRA